MEKKYLEIALQGRLIGTFENVKDFVETENLISFKSDEGEFEIAKDQDGKYKTRVFGQPVWFDSYRLIGRRTILKDIDANNLGHSKEQKNVYDARIAKAQAAMEKFENITTEHRNEIDLTDEELNAILRQTEHFRADKGMSYCGYDRAGLNSIVRFLNNFYIKVSIRQDGSLYYVVFEGLK